MDHPVGFWETAGRLALAAVAGAVLGWEREFRDKPAGLRTHMMVSLGAAVFMVISLRLSVLSNAEQSHLDPLRVLQGIIGGVGFLGAGAIIQSGIKVHGLTTAAGIWLTAAIGVTCGIGFYDIAGLGVGLGLVVLLLVGFVEHRYLEPRKGEEPPPSD
jgi:putative Mg2+ transporter-C (MgtC) family protein